jgi:hypothetical protein
MNVGWIDVDPAVSVYQSRSYGEAAVLSSGARWEVIGSEDGRWRVPLALSPIGPSGGEDAASPYGYAGLHADVTLQADEIDAAWAGTLDAMRDRGLVSAFLRFAPYRRGVETTRSLDRIELIELSETIAVRLGDERTMWDSMHGRSRTAVRKAEREGLSARFSVDVGRDLAQGHGFRHVYEEAMRRVAAAPHHFHGDEYYERLSSAPDVEMHLLEVVDADGNVVAATLLLVDSEAVHYHLSGSLTEGAKRGANNLMIWTVMKWAAQRGHGMLHLGGGTSRGDGLYRFKASFGGEALPFLSGRVILDADAYDARVHERAESLNVAVADLRKSPFFPAYRATVDS